MVLHGKSVNMRIGNQNVNEKTKIDFLENSKSTTSFDDASFCKAENYLEDRLRNMRKAHHYTAGVGVNLKRPSGHIMVPKH